MKSIKHQRDLKAGTELGLFERVITLNKTSLTNKLNSFHLLNYEIHY